MYASAHESFGDDYEHKNYELVKDRQYLTRRTVEDVFSSWRDWDIECTDTVPSDTL